MRSLFKTAVLALALALAGVSARAQDAPALPKAPVPYSKLRPKARPAALPARPPAVAPSKASAPVAASAPASVRLAPGQAIPPAELQAFVDGWMAKAMARDHLPGVTVSIVQNGQVVLKKGYGFADARSRRKVDPDRTLFRLGSISKTFAWILLMRDVEAGRIRLDRPVNAYLPEKVRVRRDGQARPVLVANLMDHTAGFEDRALGQLFERDPRKVRPLELDLRQERPRRVRPPGVLSSYSNYGAALAGEIAARVSGETFERRVETEITLPLGMTRTTFRELRAERPGLPAPMPGWMARDIATGYGWTPTGFEPRPYEYIGQVAPAGAASSTAGDMARYMLMLLGDGSWNGASVFGPVAARAFRTPMQKTPDMINGWAHGFAIVPLPGGYTGYHHDGATMAFHSSLTVAPALGLGLFITTNGESGGPAVRQFPEHVVRHFYAEPAVFPRPGQPALAAHGAAYAGDYLTTHRTYGGLEGFVRLFVSGAKVRATPDGRLVTITAEDVNTWTPIGPPAAGRFISTEGEARLAFRMADGRATAFTDTLNAQSYERASFWMRLDVMAVAAGLAAAAAVVTLLGLALRNRRELRQNATQSRAALVQNIQAGLWIAALSLFGAWAIRAADPAQAMFGWPSPLILTASTCALVAASLNLIALAALPAVWQGGRRVDSWPVLRKLSFTVTVLVYLAFSVLLGLRGALAPWSS